MSNLITLVAAFKAAWRKKNIARSEDYLMGGAVMALELGLHISGNLKAAPDPETAKLRKELSEALNRNRELRLTIDRVEEAQHKANKQLPEVLASAMLSGGANKHQADEINRLRKKVVQQEEQLKNRGLHIQSLMKELGQIKQAK